MSTSFQKLVREIRHCRHCEPFLEHEARPVFRAHPEAVILIAGQAPGRRVHESGIPFDDPSGERLRKWLGVSSEEFYDERKFAIVPMGFCYPGTGKSGDLPPRPECAELWRSKLLDQLHRLELTLVIGKYAHDWHLGKNAGTLTATVRDWQHYWPNTVPLPHPSPRNNLWLRKNPWFEKEVIPPLQAKIDALIR